MKRRDDEGAPIHTEGLPLFTDPPPEVRGLARRPDRTTSVEAALAVAPHLSALQAEVLDFLRAHGPATDEQINDAFQRRAPGRYAESTVRHRRSDLTAKGLVVADGEEENSRGQRVNVWKATT